MNKITEQLLKAVSDWKGNFKGAYNIRGGRRLRRKTVLGTH